MTIHRSLRGIDTLKGERSVLTRFERIQKMLANGKLEAERDSAFGLPKMRTHFKVISGKRAKEVAKDKDAKDGKDAKGKEDAADAADAKGAKGGKKA